MNRSSEVVGRGRGAGITGCCWPSWSCWFAAGCGEFPLQGLCQRATFIHQMVVALCVCVGGANVTLNKTRVSSFSPEIDH